MTIASVLSKGAASEVVKQQKFDPDLDEEGIDRLESTTEGKKLARTGTDFQNSRVLLVENLRPGCWQVFASSGGSCCLHRYFPFPLFIEDLMLAGVTPPDPVFFCSVEPPSLMEQKKLDVALANLEREDPSLRVRNDEETGQTILEGVWRVCIFKGHPWEVLLATR